MKKDSNKQNINTETLLIKNYSGSFNDEGIGHEIINSFDANNNDNDWCIFYVPPYGSVGKETIDFINEPVYKNIKKILIFDSTSITNILKLKAVVIKPIPITDVEDFKKIPAVFKYGKSNTPLSKIDFYDKEFSEKKEVESKIDIFPFTYKVKKEKYYNLEKYNLFVWHKRNKASNALLNDSKSKFKIVFKGCTKLEILNDTTLGEKNYSYNLGNDVERWFQKEVKPLLRKENVYHLEKVPSKLKLNIKYNKNNFLENINKVDDENLYTNFICYILNSNKKLREKFFEFLVNKYCDGRSYKSKNVLAVKPQYQALTPIKKCFNKYLGAHKKGNKDAEKYKETLIKTYKLTRSSINQVKNKFVGGMIDIYLQDDNYAIAIENKIKSGINGKNSEIAKDLNQLKTYKTFLKDQADYKFVDACNYKVILLAPEKIKNNFVNYDPDVPVMSDVN